MAGETLLSAASDNGVYLLIENNSWHANNTPNTCNLGGGTGLVLGTGYMYFDDVVSLNKHAETPNTDNFIGWTFAQDGTTWLKTTAITGQAIFSSFQLNVIVDSTKQQNFEKFFDLHQATKPAQANFQLYLVRQWASTTFKQFSYNGTLYKSAAVVLTDYDINEVSQQGKDAQSLRIGMVFAYRKNTG
jgi:hypothetical protein